MGIVGSFQQTDGTDHRVRIGYCDAKHSAARHINLKNMKSILAQTSAACICRKKKTIFGTKICNKRVESAAYHRGNRSRRSSLGVSGLGIETTLFQILEDEHMALGTIDGHIPAPVYCPALGFLVRAHFVKT
jgi:hypothetical protein